MHTTHRHHGIRIENGKLYVSGPHLDRVLDTTSLQQAKQAINRAIEGDAQAARDERIHRAEAKDRARKEAAYHKGRLVSLSDLF